MEISKTSLNFAKKRGLELELVDGELSVFLAGECEPEFVLFASETGSFTFKARVGASQDLISEIPAYYKDETALRMMLAFVAEESK